MHYLRKQILKSAAIYKEKKDEKEKEDSTPYVYPDVD